MALMAHLPMRRRGRPGGIRAMTLPDLISALGAQGVRLSARLVVDAPSGALTPELRGVLAAHKVPILEKIVREMMWEKLSSQRWGPAAADPSTGIVVEQPDRG